MPVTARYFKYLPVRIKDPTGQMATDHYIQMNEFAFLDGGSVVPGGTWTDIGWAPVGQEADKLADGNVATVWLNYGILDDPDHWYQGAMGGFLVDFGSPVTIDGYRWRTGADAEWRDPWGWAIYSSTDNWATETLIDFRTGWWAASSRNQWQPDFVLPASITTQRVLEFWEPPEVDNEPWTLPGFEGRNNANYSSWTADAWWTEFWGASLTYQEPYYHACGLPPRHGGVRSCLVVVKENCPVDVVPIFAYEEEYIPGWVSRLSLWVYNPAGNPRLWLRSADSTGSIMGTDPEPAALDEAFSTVHDAWEQLTVTAPYGLPHTTNWIAWQIGFETNSVRREFYVDDYEFWVERP